MSVHIFLFFLFSISTRISKCSHEFVAHNFVQYQVGGNDFGLPHLAVHGKLRQFLPQRFGLKDDSDRFDNEFVKMLRKERTVYLLRLEDLLTKRFHWLFFKNVLKTNNVLLLIIPESHNVLLGKNKNCDEAFATDFANPKLQKCKNLDHLHQDTLVKFEKFLYKSKPKCSLSITELNSEMLNVLNTTKSSGGVLNDDVRVNTKDFDSKLLSNFLTINLYGEMNTSNLDENTEGAKKKKVLLTANLDTFGVLQTYSSTAQYNTSLIALLELLRLLKGVKSDTYDLVFLLYSGSAINYSGLKHFFHQYNKKEKNKEDKEFELVINLQDLSGEKLYLYTLRKHYDDLHPVLKHFDNQMNVKIVVQEEDENLKEDEKPKDDLGLETPAQKLQVNLPNEVNSKTKSFTLTSNDELMPLYKKSYSFNFKYDTDLLANRVSGLYHSMLSLLNSTESPNQVDHEQLKSNLEKWNERLKEPRNSLITNLLLLNSVKDVISHLEENLGKIQIQNFRTLVNDHKFYTSSPNHCTVFVTKHPAFDLVVLFLVTAYILGVWTLVRGSPTAAIDDITDIFQQVFNEKNFKLKTK